MKENEAGLQFIYFLSSGQKLGQEKLELMLFKWFKLELLDNVNVFEV